MEAKGKFLKIIALAPALFFLISCGETHSVAQYQYRGQMSVNTAPVQTNAPLVSIPTHPDVWVGAFLSYYGMTFVPSYEVPCDNGGGVGEYAYRCVSQHITTLCQALDPLAGAPAVLTRTQANGRTAWFEKCYGTFPDFMTAQGVASGMASPGRHLCPEYVEMAVYDSTGALVFVSAPTSATASCGSVPVNAFPAGFRTTPL